MTSATGPGLLIRSLPRFLYRHLSRFGANRQTSHHHLIIQPARRARPGREEKTPRTAHTAIAFSSPPHPPHGRSPPFLFHLLAVSGPRSGDTEAMPSHPLPHRTSSGDTATPTPDNISCSVRLPLLQKGFQSCSTITYRSAKHLRHAYSANCDLFGDCTFRILYRRMFFGYGQQRCRLLSTALVERSSDP